MSVAGRSSLKYTEEPLFLLNNLKRENAVLNLTTIHLNSQYSTSYMKLKDFLTEMLDLLHVGLCPQHLPQLSLLLLSVLSVPPTPSGVSLQTFAAFSLFPSLIFSSPFAELLRFIIFLSVLLRDLEWCTEAPFININK